MITKILYGAIGEIPQRTTFPQEKTDRYGGYPRLVKAHTEKFHRFGESKERHRERPDEVWIGSYSTITCPVKRGIAADRRGVDGKTYGIRVIDQEYVNRLDELDHKFDELKRELFDTMEEAMRHGRPLKVSEITEA